MSATGRKSQGILLVLCMAAGFALVGLSLLRPGPAAALDAILTDDAYTDAAKATTNFGTNVALKVSATTRTFLKFDFAPLPACPAALPPRQLHTVSLNNALNDGDSLQNDFATPRG